MLVSVPNHRLSVPGSKTMWRTVWPPLGIGVGEVHSPVPARITEAEEAYLIAAANRSMVSLSASPASSSVSHASISASPSTKRCSAEISLR